MLRCVICHFDVQLDDVALGASRGRCVCLCCYGRETGSRRVLPKSLQRELRLVFTSLPAEPDPWADGDSA